MTPAAVVVAAGLAVASAIAGAVDAPTAGAEREALFARLEKSDVVQEGAKDAKSVLYVFFDANCLYCHLTWKALQPYEREGLQVRWVPVAYQKTSSAGRAAAIMQAPDRVAALRLNESTYDANRFEGGIEPSVKVPASVVAELQANTELMRKFGAPGTPALVWRDRGGEVQFKVGVPRLSELPQITGLQAQRDDDPELAKFR